MLVSRALFLGAALVLLATTGCDGDGGSGQTTPAIQGGSSGSGGAGSGAGGTPPSTGGSGGTTKATTVAGSGGIRSSGGAASSGGTTGTAGAPGSGGAQASGGSQGTGGAQGRGGSQGSGGSQATGGSQRTGGSQGSGGQATGGSQGSGGRVTGGSQGSGGRATGGSQASGGSQRTGGSQGTGGSRGTGGSTGNPNAIGPTKTCGCLTSSGNYSGNPLTATIVVEAGEVYDGGCKTYVTKSLSSGGLGDGSQEENQKPLFRVNAGGKLMNVILGAPAADGVHFYGNATAENIHWLDIGEDAATIKADATVTLDCGSAKNGSDKVFQVNAKATWTVSNFTISGAGKGMRENGDKCYPVNAIFDHCDISDLDEVIFRTDCTSSTATIRNTRYSGIRDGLVMVGSTIYNSTSGNVTVTNVQKY